MVRKCLLGVGTKGTGSRIGEFLEEGGSPWEEKAMVPPFVTISRPAERDGVCCCMDWRICIMGKLKNFFHGFCVPGP